MSDGEQEALRAAIARAEEVAGELAREKRSSAFLRARFDELADEFGLAPEDHAGIARAARGREGSHAALRKIAGLLGLPVGYPLNPDQVAEAARQRLATPSWLTDLWHALGVPDATGGTIHQALRAVQEIARRAKEADAALQGLANKIGDDDLPTHQAIAAAVCSRFERGEEAENALAEVWKLAGETEAPAFYSDVVGKVERLVETERLREERHASVVNVLADAQALILRLASRIGVRSGEDVEAALVRFLEALPGSDLDSVRRTLEARRGAGPDLAARGPAGGVTFLGGRGGQTPGADGEDGQGLNGGTGGKGGRGGAQ